MKDTMGEGWQIQKDLTDHSKDSAFSSRLEGTPLRALGRTVI